MGDHGHLGLAVLQQSVDDLRAMPADEPTKGSPFLRKAALQGQPSGLSASNMIANQFDALMALMEVYARNVSHELAEGRTKQINEAGRNIYFAWSGSINSNEPHYYRVQTPSFLIELDDTQDDANHIHSVWRDFSGDFGQDLLQHHYQVSHQKK